MCLKAVKAGTRVSSFYEGKRILSYHATEMVKAANKVDDDWELEHLKYLDATSGISNYELDISGIVLKLHQSIYEYLSYRVKDKFSIDGIELSQLPIELLTKQLHEFALVRANKKLPGAAEATFSERHLATFIRSNIGIQQSLVYPSAKNPYKFPLGPFLPDYFVIGLRDPETHKGGHRHFSMFLEAEGWDHAKKESKDNYKQFIAKSFGSYIHYVHNNDIASPLKLFNVHGKYLENDCESIDPRATQNHLLNLCLHNVAVWIPLQKMDELTGNQYHFQRGFELLTNDKRCPRSLKSAFNEALKLEREFRKNRKVIQISKFQKPKKTTPKVIRRSNCK